jgi:hypothetical protein
MVNRPGPCDHEPAVRRPLAALALIASLSACAGDGGRELARYYDPEGYFVTSLPAANELVVTPPQPGVDGPGLLTGVVARPPAPSPAPQAGFGRGFAVSQTEVPDQTVYQAIAISTDGFADLDEMGLFLLTGDPVTDVQIDDVLRIDGLEARLVVADLKQEGTVTASVAAAFTLGIEGTGFLVAAAFPPGQWDGERGDFFRMVDSFRTRISPGLAAFPVTA